MAFLSILTSCKVFQEAHIGTMLVCHTHKGTDGYLTYVSKETKN